MPNISTHSLIFITFLTLHSIWEAGFFWQAFIEARSPMTMRRVICVYHTKKVGEVNHIYFLPICTGRAEMNSLVFVDVKQFHAIVS